MMYRKCKECGQHNANLLDSVCFECREFEYEMNLGKDYNLNLGWILDVRNTFFWKRPRLFNQWH